MGGDEEVEEGEGTEEVSKEEEGEETKEGKEADVVLWNNHPMSIYAKVEKTIIDGKVFFDVNEDVKKREAIKEEKSNLINMMLKEKMGGAQTRVPMKREDRNFHCDTLEETKS